MPIPNFYIKKRKFTDSLQYPRAYLVPNCHKDVLAAHGVQVHLGKDAAVVGGLPDDAETLGLELGVHRQLSQTDNHTGVS